jgi:twinkle protein
MKTWADFRIEIPSNASGEVDTRCPECSATRRKKTARCLSVNVREGIWHCHHCGWSGTLKDGQQNAPRVQYRRPDPLPVKLDPVVEWFSARGIPQRVLERNRITAATVYMPQVEDHVTAIAYPFYRAGELVNVKYRDRQKNFRMVAGAERILYGLDDIAARTVIVEGEMDKLAVEAAGITACVSVPDGAPTPNTKDYASKFSFLDEARLEAVETWVIAVDNDEPGRRLESELVRRFGRERCLRVTWPEGCKDANDVLLSHGPKELAAALEAAQPYPIEGVHGVQRSAIRDLYETGLEKGVSTGWDELDQFYTVRPGEFTVVTGIPNSGKSNWLDALCVNLAAAFDWRFGMFSPENQPIADHQARVLEKYIGKPFSDGPTERMTQDEREQGLDWLDDHFFWILPDDDDEWSIETVLTAAQALVRRRGIRGLVIDPWNELEHHRAPHQTETEYISVSLKRMRNFARKNGVHLWIVAHPKMLSREDGKYPVPSLYDISGSAHWRNKADNGVVVWREMGKEAKTVDIHVQKIRFRQIGKLGTASLEYRKATATYHEVSPLRGRR